MSFIKAIFLLPLCFVLSTCMSSGMRIGVGSSDVTGPVADVNFMGYAIMGQVGRGLHMRQYSRAFIFAQPATHRMVAFVSVDVGMGSGVVQQKVLELLQADPTTAGLFNHTNLCISGTHTHSAPAGFLSHTIFQVSSLGFVRQTYDALANGIAASVIKACANLQPGSVTAAIGQLKGANINRSPTAYLKNPEAERAQYDGDTDSEMLLLRLSSIKASARRGGSGSGDLGMVNWFAVHGTSLNNTNTLVSGDNKGLASYLFEKQRTPGFVGAFAAANLGDISPNTRGAFCQDTGKPCDTVHSTCNGKNELCVGRGPGSDMFDSMHIIAEKQLQAAEQLFSQLGRTLDGTVDSRVSFIRPGNSQVTLDNGTVVQTCDPAFGYAFAAGTTDGPGMFNFQQSTTSGNPFWNALSHFLSKPTPEQQRCHAPKPILLNVANITKPYTWSAEVLPLQLLRVGALFVVVVPTELTTMAGRRMRNAVRKEVMAVGLESSPLVVISGLANDYGDYTATWEEYQEQRYEGASTVYGPHELQLFISHMRRLVRDMASGRPSDTLQPPHVDVSQMLELLPPVLFDTAGLTHSFGEVTQQPQAKYTTNQTVSVKFRSANPRNDLRTGDTFLRVERQTAAGAWQTQLTDADWETRFVWGRPFDVSSESTATIEWTIAADTAAGEYRIRHFNSHKDVLGKITSFEGTSNTFQVV